VMSSAASLWKLFRDHAERDSGIGLKLFGFIAESVFTIIPEPSSGSSWNSVRNHPGIAFTLNRIPHVSEISKNVPHRHYFWHATIFTPRRKTPPRRAERLPESQHHGVYFVVGVRCRYENPIRSGRTCPLLVKALATITAYGAGKD
jgi:hypothetical protein